MVIVKKTTALGGLLVIVPIAIILFVLGQLLLALLALANDVVARLGIGIDDVLVMSPIALLALVGLRFVTGLAVRTRLGDALKGWFGRNVARRIPMYSAISNLTKRFAGIDGSRRNGRERVPCRQGKGAAHRCIDVRHGLRDHAVGRRCRQPVRRQIRGRQRIEPGRCPPPSADQLWSSVLAPGAQFATLLMPLLQPDSEA